MKRRNLFLTFTMLPAALALVTVLTACDQDSGGSGNNQGQSVPNPSPSPAPNPTPGPTPGAGQACLNGAQSAIMAGGNPSHTHGSTNISATDVSTGTQRTYDVPAENGHTHKFTLQATHFAMMRANGSASTSTIPDANGHFHAVSVICN